MKSGGHLVAILTLGSLAYSEVADASELLYSKSGKRVHWMASEIRLEPVVPRQLPIQLLVSELRAATEIWNDALANTGAPRFRVEPPSAARPPVGRVGRNGQSIVVFQT